MNGIIWTCLFFSFCSSSHWRGHQRSGGDPGRPGIRLLIFPVPFPATTFAGTRTLVLSAHVPFSLLLLLQELCLHYGALLVRVLLWVLSTGERFILRLKKKLFMRWCHDLCLLCFLWFRLSMTNTSSLSTISYTHPCRC